MEKRSILIQLDSDRQPSVFDRVVAIDAGAEEIFSYGGVNLEQVRGLVHGAIFTRGPKHLKRTAIFIGGSDVGVGEQLLQEVLRHMIPQFGLRVSVMLDPNGANTTAAAAVRSAIHHVDPAATKALVLAGTGPVGQRVARLLARLGASVRIGSRQAAKADAVCAAIRTRVPNACVEPAATGTWDELNKAIADQTLVISAGAEGVELIPKAVRLACNTLKVAIDLNAVPPLGIEGIEVTDKAKEREGVTCFGAIGVGDTKMKIHKAAVASLFASNDQVLDAEECYAISEKLDDK